MQNWSSTEAVFPASTMEEKLALSQGSLYTYFPKSSSFRCLKGRQPISRSQSDEECDSFTVNRGLAQLFWSLWKAIRKRTKERMGPGTPSMLMYFLFHKFTVRCNKIIKMIVKQVHEPHWFGCQCPVLLDYLNLMCVHFSKFQAIISKNLKKR